MENSSTLFMIAMAAMVIILGLKTLITREATLVAQLWGSGDVAEHQRDGGGVCSESSRTGFIAVLVGLAELGMGLQLLAKALA